MSDADPDIGAAVEYATGDGPTGASESTESTETSSAGSSSSTSTLKDAALSTEPDPPLESVDSPYDPQRGGLARVYRGLMKAVGIDGTPAIVDLALGMVELSVGGDLAVDEGDQDDIEQASDEPEGYDTL